MIIFESHATSIDNEKGVASGWLDPQLAPLGIEQAKELGRRYSPQQFSAIYTSDLSRSRQTAEIAFPNAAIFAHALLREWNYGDLNGYPNSEIESLKINHIIKPFPNGESLTQAIERFIIFKEELPTNPILIIGHRATYYALEHLFKNIPLSHLVTASWSWQPGWLYSYDA